MINGRPDTDVGAPTLFLMIAASRSVVSNLTEKSRRSRLLIPMILASYCDGTIQLSFVVNLDQRRNTPMISPAR